MKIPKVTSILLVVLTTFTLLNFILKYYTYFVLVVTSSKSANEVNSIAQETGEVPHPHELYVPLLTFIPTKSPVITRPWVLITSSFIEENFVGLFVSFVLFFYMGKYLETMWGPRQFAEFILSNVILSNVLLYLYYTSKAMLASDPASLTVPPVVISAMAINMGFFVAIKKRIPAHYIIFFKGNLRLKVTYLPFMLIVTYYILQFITEEFYISFLLSIIGFFISWSYLRFYKSGTNERQSYLLPLSLSRKRSNKGSRPVKSVPSVPSVPSSSSSIHIDTGIRGDRSEQFALYTFFPYPLSIVVKYVTNAIFNVLVHYKFVNPKNYFDDLDNTDIEDQLMFDDMTSLQTKLFGLSPLKGAGDVATIPTASSVLKRVWHWISRQQDPSAVGIKTSMDKRRKQALRELE